MILKRKPNLTIYDEDDNYDWDNNYIQTLKNGYVWNAKYYPTLEELEKEYGTKLHIGKSSYGWNFNLCIYPDLGINNLNDWKKMFETHDIYNEEDEKITAEEMIDRIVNRKGNVTESDLDKIHVGSASVNKFGLLQHNGYQFTNTDGPYDYNSEHDFS